MTFDEVVIDDEAKTRETLVPQQVAQPPEVPVEPPRRHSAMMAAIAAALMAAILAAAATWFFMRSEAGESERADSGQEAR